MVPGYVVTCRNLSCCRRLGGILTVLVATFDVVVIVRELVVADILDCVYIAMINL